MKTMKNLVDSYRDGCGIDGMLMNALTSALNRETKENVQVNYEDGNLCIWFGKDWYEMPQTDEDTEKYIIASISEGTYKCDFTGKVIEKISYSSEDLEKIKFPWL